MPEFIIAYRGGRKPESPEAGAAQKEKWMAWIGGLGDAVVNPGTPCTGAMTVTPSGVEPGGEHALTGYSVVNADSMDAALEIARACPFLEMGTLEVAEQVKM